MNRRKPVELSQKIDYLNEKIFKVHAEIRKSDDLELRLNFQQFIDTCITQILGITENSALNNEENGSTFVLSEKEKNKAKTKQDRVKNGELGNIYSSENEKLQLDKKIVQYQLKQLQSRQLQLQYQTNKMKLYNIEKQFEKAKNEKEQLKKTYNADIKSLKDKNKFLEQEIENVVKLNKSQEEEIRIVKEQRNRAEQKQLEIQEKYDEQIAKLEKFGEKKPRYIDRNTEGIRCIRTYTNIGASGTQSQKILILKLPTIIEVSKLVYGVMLGVVVSNKQIMYYDKVQLYQKQITNIDLENQSLVLSFKRRKQSSRIVLDKYVVRTPEVVIMLYGKGDSILVHDEVKNMDTKSSKSQFSGKKNE